MQQGSVDSASGVELISEMMEDLVRHSDEGSERREQALAKIRRVLHV